MNQGTIIVEDLNGNVVWKGFNFKELGVWFNLPYKKYKHLSTRFKVGMSPLINNHITYITIPNCKTYYGGDCYR